MHQEQFPVPVYPDLTFRGVSFSQLNQRVPNYRNTAKWYARVIISVAFLLIATITTLTCYYFGLTDDTFFIATLVGTLLLYAITMPLLTQSIADSPRVQKKMKASRRRFFHKALSNTPLDVRLEVANRIWHALKDEQWNLCISYAHTNNAARTVQCCRQIGKIASALPHTDPEIYCDAMLKTSNNQRGSIRYFFDIIVMLGEQQFQEENEDQKKIRTTQRLMLDDIFSHR